MRGDVVQPCEYDPDGYNDCLSFGDDDIPANCLNDLIEQFASIDRLIRRLDNPMFV